MKQELCPYCGTILSEFKDARKLYNTRESIFVAVCERGHEIVK